MMQILIQSVNDSYASVFEKILERYGDVKETTVITDCIEVIPNSPPFGLRIIYEFKGVAYHIKLRAGCVQIVTYKIEGDNCSLIKTNPEHITRNVVHKVFCTLNKFINQSWK